MCAWTDKKLSPIYFFEAESQLHFIAVAFHLVASDADRPLGHNFTVLKFHIAILTFSFVLVDLLAKAS